MTTLPAPITALSPMVTPGRMTAPPPIQTWLPIVTSAVRRADRQTSARVGIHTFVCRNRVNGGVNFHIGAEQGIVADGNSARVQKGAVHIDKAAGAEGNMAAVVHPHRLIDTGIFTAKAKQQTKDPIPQLPIFRGQAVVNPHKVFGIAAQTPKLRIPCIIEFAAAHFFFFRHKSYASLKGP